MDRFYLALFVHVLGFALAAGVTALVKFSLGRRNRARSVGEMLEWHTLLMRSAGFFPIALVILVLSGGYMVRVSHMAWSTPFVIAGLVAVGILLLGGILLGVAGRAFQKQLEALAASGTHQLPPRPEPWFAPIVSYANAGLVAGVVFDMATRQTSLATAITALVIGFILGALIGARTVVPAVAKVAAPVPNA